LVEVLGFIKLIFSDEELGHTLVNIDVKRVLGTPVVGHYFQCPSEPPVGSFELVVHKISLHENTAEPH